MAYIPLRSEKSVSELVDKVYSNLSDKDRKAAEAAIIKANPALKDMSNLKRGTLITIPKVKNLKPKKTRSVTDPDGDLVEDYVQRLDAFSEMLAKNNALRDQQQKESQAVLKKSDVKKILDSSDEAKQVVEQLQQHISEDGKIRKEIETATSKFFKDLQKDLEKLMK